jgi:hypothetical protein
MSWNSNPVQILNNSKVAVPPLGPAPWWNLPFVTSSTVKHLPRVSLGVFVASCSGNVALNGLHRGLRRGRNLAAHNLTYRSIAPVKLQCAHRIACLMRKFRLTAHHKEFAQ